MVKNSLIIGICLLFASCGNNNTTVEDGCINNNGSSIKIGQHFDFINVLHNGDSLFYYYEVKGTSAMNMHYDHCLYYTSNMGRTGAITWAEGKNSTQTNLQHK